MKRTLRLIVMVALAASSAAAQDRLATGSRVRLALPGGEMVEGTLVGGDSAVLRVRTDERGAMVVPRQRILLMTTAPNEGGNRAFHVGLMSGGFSALLFGALTVRCNDDRNCRPHAQTMVSTALAGLAVGSFWAGGLSPVQWRAVETSALVSGGAFDADGRETCRARPSSLEARAGLSNAGSRTGSAALSLVCIHGVNIGAEGGVLRDLSIPGKATYENNYSDNYYYYYATIGHHETRKVSFVGMTGDVAISGPLNPHILVSSGSYRRSDEIVTKSTSYNYANNSEMTATQSVSSMHTGFGTGVSFSMPVARNVSLGLIARTHFLFGPYGGTINTIEATARLR